ncbi:MAG: hypothetical protein JWL77_6883, partial [Chthonomonadaceae bacterium]|nr:hypothetical protein [Chthonomonadaceae bacterium]
MGSSPNFTYKQVPTAGQWNAAFAAKQDELGYTPMNPAGSTMTGELGLTPSTSNSSGLNVSPGIAPSAPKDGDMWTTA